MKLFNIERSSTYYSDKNIKKLRWISIGLTLVGVLMFVIVFLTWKDEYSEVEFEGLSTLLKMPFILIVGAILMFIISGIVRYVAIGKAVIKEIKSNDNPFLTDELNNKDSVDKK